jgi:anti-sigma B factor antagonist
MAATDRDRTLRSAPGRLEITVSAHGTTTTIALAGEWDLAELQATRQAIRDALRRSPECLVLDLSQLTFIDSSGIHVVHELHKRSTHQDAHLVIVPGSGAVQRTFEVLGLVDALPFLTAADELGHREIPERRRPRRGIWPAPSRRQDC